MLTTPTIKEIQTNIIADIEAKIGQTIPILAKAVFIILAYALAGAWIILYKFGTDAYRQRFVQTANRTWLVMLGELIGIFIQSATTWIGQAEIEATGAVGTIVSGTQFLRTETGIVYIVQNDVAIVPGTLTLDLYSGTSGDIGNLLVADELDIVSPISGIDLTAVVSAVTVQGEDEEDLETYRQRVLDGYQKKPQGGASADYESWGKQAPHVLSVYPYPAVIPGWVDIFVEVDDQTDGIPNNFGTGWDEITAAEDNSWKRTAFGNGVLIAISQDGTNRIMRSIDRGETWEAIAAPEDNTLEDITWGNGVFVIVCSDGVHRVFRSLDNGSTWITADAAEANAWKGISYGEGVFTAVSEDGTNRVMYSTDNGASWTASAAEANQWQKLAFGQGTFVAIANSGIHRVMYSTDGGVNWTAIAAAEDNTWEDICFLEDVFIAVASDGTNRVMRSENYAVTWTAIAAAEANAWKGIDGGSRVLQAVSEDGTNRTMRSLDLGETWTAVAAAEDNQWQGICYAPGMFCSVADSGTHRIMITKDAELEDVREYETYNPITGKQNRKPVTAGMNIFPISRYSFDITINGLSPDLLDTRNAIDAALENYMNGKEPYIRGLTVVRNDIISKMESVSVALAVAQSLEATFSNLTLFDETGAIDLCVLARGQKAKLGTVTYA